jgi:hypothetical protein
MQLADGIYTWSGNRQKLFRGRLELVRKNDFAVGRFQSRYETNPQSVTGKSWLGPIARETNKKQYERLTPVSLHAPKRFVHCLE